MTVDWSPLTDALKRARAAGLDLPVWWRDDDAIAPTPALERLLALADEIAVPVHLAVIPESAKPELAPFVATRNAHPLVHGWAHRDTSLPDVKKSEFGRPREDAQQEVHNGFGLLRSIFGPGLLPVFVPPWNRIDPVHYPALRAAGFAALSTFGPRPKAEAVPGLAQINTHVDPIAWRTSRDLVAPTELIALTAQLIDDRLQGKSDAQEPLGLLTHHLVHTPAIWSFSREWLLTMRAGGARVWTFTETGEKA